MNKVKQAIKFVVGDDRIYSIRRTIGYLRNPEKKVQIQNELFHITSKAENFCGYYDRNIISEGKVAYLRTNEQCGDADICLFDTLKNESITITRTSCWNWQQGCRLMWVNYNSRSMLSYNDVEKNNYISRLIDPSTKQVLSFDWPVYDIADGCKYALSCDFSRLGKMRPGYGYTILDNRELDNNIYVCNYDTNTKKICVSQDMISRILAENCIKNNVENSYINHICISPNGESFIFFYIEIIERKHKAFLFFYSFAEQELSMLESELIVSHYCWIDNEKILVTAYDSGWNCKYYLYGKNGRTTIRNKHLLVDGHPTYIGNDEIITDTYPDEHGFQRVLKCNLYSNNAEQIAKVYHTGNRREEKRCDLHPKVDPENRIIVIDTNVFKHREIRGVKY